MDETTQVRKLSQLGKYSKILVLPKQFLRELGWREDQKLAVQFDRRKKRLIIRDAPST